MLWEWFRNLDDFQGYFLVSLAIVDYIFLSGLLALSNIHSIPAFERLGLVPLSIDLLISTQADYQLIAKAIYLDKFSECSVG